MSMSLPKPNEVSFAQMVGIDDIGPDVKMWQFPVVEAVKPWIPRVYPNYHFRKELLLKLRNFLLLPNDDGFFLTGPMGSGKTSLVNQLLGLCRWPVQTLTLNRRFEFQQLVGQFTLQARAPGETPEMKFRYGPLALAMKLGHVLILNEIDRADAGELTGLHDVIEGRPLVISETGGEIIRPHPLFRIICTANSAGHGDLTGLNDSVNRLDAAFMDRFRVAHVPYMREQDEVALVSKSYPSALVDQMVSFANQTRANYLSGTATPMSTRVLQRWSHLMATYRGAPNAMELALDEAFLQRLEPPEKLAVENAAVATFGDLYRQAA